MPESDLTGNSRPVTSSQTGCHDALESTVKRHLTHPFRKPVVPHNQQAFDEALKWREKWQREERPLILDSFCGTAQSTIHLAQRFPDHQVIGVDKSAHRLQRPPAEVPENALLVRADVDDFWRLAQTAQWRPEKHYLLYPNPWPKPAHLQRRVHGSPLFPTLLALGGELELRSNWQLYLQEFAMAIELAGGHAMIEPLALHNIDDAVTAFERKYALSGQTLYRYIARP